MALPLGATWIIWPPPPDVGEGPVEFTESLADITVDVPADVIIEDSEWVDDDAAGFQRLA